MKNSTILHYLENASKDYYNGNPTIPDEVFDRLAESVRYDAVGARSGDIPHLYPVSSLEKFYPSEGLEPTRKFINPVRTPKLDGACITATYIRGDLVRVLTRGDGIRGKDITNKFLETGCIPTKIPYLEPIQIALEAVAPKTIENARNYAAGALGLKDVKEFATRDLTFVAHGVQPALSTYFTTDMHYLGDIGFKVITNSKSFFDVFPQDGEVVREDSNGAYDGWGSTNHHPKGAYAIKTRKPPVQTKLLDVIWQVGKSGKVTPVAQLDPVDIDGAMVSKASLHNIAFIEQLDLDIGDTVELIRSGEIIPYIVGKVT